jgi:quinol monooxygenase YgiN
MQRRLILSITGAAIIAAAMLAKVPAAQSQPDAALTQSKPLTLALFARMEAKPGKEEEVAAFLRQALQLANQEATTPTWFALRIGPSTFGVFDAFYDEAGRQNHLRGPIRKALMEKAPSMLVGPPVIEQIEILGAKFPE